MSIVINGESYTTLSDYKNDESKMDSVTKAYIELEVALIGKLIELRESRGVSQSTLAKMSGLKQPAIARLEGLHAEPRISTLLKLLIPMGYTLDIVPLPEH